MVQIICVSVIKDFITQIQLIRVLMLVFNVTIHARYAMDPWLQIVLNVSLQIIEFLVVEIVVLALIIFLKILHLGILLGKIAHFVIILVLIV